MNNSVKIVSFYENNLGTYKNTPTYIAYDAQNKILKRRVLTYNELLKPIFGNKHMTNEQFKSILQNI